MDGVEAPFVEHELSGNMVDGANGIDGNDVDLCVCVCVRLL